MISPDLFLSLYNFAIIKIGIDRDYNPLFILTENSVLEL